MIELARYQEGPSSVVVSRDGDELRFASSYDDYGRTKTEESRIAVADFVAKGEGPWPWYDLGDKREGALLVLDALGVDWPDWTNPLSDEALDLFGRARAGSTEVIELLAWGAEPDPLDPCGASPLWYGVRSLSAGIVVALIDAGADAGRRIELSAQGDNYTPRSCTKSSGWAAPWPSPTPSPRGPGQTSPTPTAPRRYTSSTAKTTT